MATLVNIAEILGTTPNWLLGVTSNARLDDEKAKLVDRFENAASCMGTDDLELCVIQAEAVAAKNEKGN